MTVIVKEMFESLQVKNPLKSLSYKSSYILFLKIKLTNYSFNITKVPLLSLILPCVVVAAGLFVSGAVVSALSAVNKKKLDE